jgi:hypothetical protein
MPLNEPQTTALALLIEGKTPKRDIAGMVGVCESTLYKWLKDAEFLAVWDREQRALSKARLHRLESEGIDPAVDALVSIVQDTDAANADRVRAAREIIVLSGHKPAERASVEHSGSVEHQMSEEQARAIIAQAVRAGRDVVPKWVEVEENTGT